MNLKVKISKIHKPLKWTVFSGDRREGGFLCKQHTVFLVNVLCGLYMMEYVFIHHTHTQRTHSLSLLFLSCIQYVKYKGILLFFENTKKSSVIKAYKTLWSKLIKLWQWIYPQNTKYSKYQNEGNSPSLMFDREVFFWTSKKI